jgi:hypothetical protein
MPDDVCMDVGTFFGVSRFTWWIHLKYIECVSNESLASIILSDTRIKTLLIAMELVMWCAKKWKKLKFTSLVYDENSKWDCACLIFLFHTQRLTITKHKSSRLIRLKRHAINLNSATSKEICSFNWKNIRHDVIAVNF